MQCWSGCIFKSRHFMLIIVSWHCHYFKQTDFVGGVQQWLILFAHCSCFTGNLFLTCETFMMRNNTAAGTIIYTFLHLVWWKISGKEGSFMLLSLLIFLQNSQKMNQYICLKASQGMFLEKIIMFMLAVDFLYMSWTNSYTNFWIYYNCSSLNIKQNSGWAHVQVIFFFGGGGRGGV